MENYKQVRDSSHDFQDLVVRARRRLRHHSSRVKKDGLPTICLMPAENIQQSPVDITPRILHSSRINPRQSEKQHTTRSVRIEEREMTLRENMNQMELRINGERVEEVLNQQPMIYNQALGISAVVNQWRNDGERSSLRRVRNTPYEIKDLLYLQGSKDVNPYIETLQALYNSGENWEDRGKLEELCYMGIGKNVVEVKKRLKPPYSRVNILIRQFMIQVMQQQIHKLQAQNKDTIYIPCCSHTLGFNTNNMNPQLGQSMTQEQYRKVVCNINKIIQYQFLSFKKKSDPEISNYVKYSFALSVVGIALLVLYIFVWSVLVLMILSWSILGLGLILNLVGVVLRQNSLHKSQSIITKIQENIEEYLGKLNKESPRTKWKCGTDFYWLEVKLVKEVTMQYVDTEGALGNNQFHIPIQQ